MSTTTSNGVTGSLVSPRQGFGEGALNQQDHHHPVDGHLAHASPSPPSVTPLAPVLTTQRVAQQPLPPGSNPRSNLVMSTRLAACRPRLAQPSRAVGNDRGSNAGRRRHAARKAMRSAPIPSSSPVGATGVDRLVALRADCAPAAARVASRSLRSLPLALRASVPLGRQAGAAGPRSTNRSPQGGNK